MKSSLRCLAAALLLATAWAPAPARAAVFFEFVQTGNTPPEIPLLARGYLGLSDAAFAAGLAVDRSYTSGRAEVLGLRAWQALGIEWFDFSVGAVGSFGPYRGFGGAALLRATPSVFGDLAARGANPDSGFAWRLQLQSAPGGVPEGRIELNDQLNNFTFVLAGEGSFGNFDSDLSTCVVTGLCGFTGRFARSDRDLPIAEPATLGLLAVASAALLGVRARRWEKAAPDRAV